jgi:cytochrome P450
MIEFSIESNITLTAALVIFIVFRCALKVYQSFSDIVVEGIPFPAHLMNPILGAAESFASLEGIRRIAVDHADADGFCSCRILGEPIVTVLRPEHIRTLLLTSNYRAQTPIIGNHVVQFLGSKSIILSMHDEWKSHRRLIGKGFNWQALGGMVPDICLVVHEFASMLISLGKTGDSCDISKELKKMTLDIIGLTGFGFHFDTVSKGHHPCSDAFEYMNDELGRRSFEDIIDLSSIFYCLPTSANKRYMRESKLLRSTIDKVVANRISAKQVEGLNEHEDFLKYMIQANSEASASAIGSAALSDNLLTLLFAGFDTTSTALTYILYL